MWKVWTFRWFFCKNHKNDAFLLSLLTTLLLALLTTILLTFLKCSNLLNKCFGANAQVFLELSFQYSTKCIFLFPKKLKG